MLSFTERALKEIEIAADGDGYFIDPLRRQKDAALYMQLALRNVAINRKDGPTLELTDDQWARLRIMWDSHPRNREPEAPPPPPTAPAQPIR